MLRQGATVTLDIEKAAAGGRMIARAGGHVVLIAGGIPGERVRVGIDKVGKGVAFGRVTAVETASPDRRVPPCSPECGGSLYAHIAYPRQLTLKSEVVSDSLKRIAKLPWSPPIEVAPSAEQGYRMRARLHWRDGRLGFFKEGSHEICEPGKTGQLLESSTEALNALAAALPSTTVRAAEIELSENVAGSERVLHIDAAAGELAALDRLGLPGVTGLASRVSEKNVERLHSGSPYVHDTLRMGEQAITLRRHVGAFFQGNRHLLDTLVQSVVAQIPPVRSVVDLYAGVGLFAAAIAAARGATVTAVEGEGAGAADLAANAAANPARFVAVHEPVERFLERSRTALDVVVIDPPRTGMSPRATKGIIRRSPRRLVYVSCDTATFARDTRALVDAGYALRSLRAFDLFPNTPHVETLATFERA